ncbi:flagellar motor switch protein FliM [Dermatophilaceae bacterium Soc4.6]
MTLAPGARRGTGSRRTGIAVAYDFRRPIQLSREHSRILQLAFDDFARQATTLFTSSLRTVCSVTLGSIDQRSYSEYITSRDSLTYLSIFTADPILGRCMLELPLPAAMTCVDHMLGGPGSDKQPQRPLSEIEGGVIGKFVVRLLGEMRYSLEGTLRIDPVVTGVEYSPQFAQVAGAADVMVVVSFDLLVDKRTYVLTLCLPFNGILPHLVAAAAPAPVSDRERALRALSADTLRAQFETVPVELTIRFRPTLVSPDMFVDLSLGDVIRLSHPAAAPLDVTADGTAFAHATPGTKGPRLAALIVGTSQEAR